MRHRLRTQNAFTRKPIGVLYKIIIVYTNTVIVVHPTYIIIYNYICH